MNCRELLKKATKIYKTKKVKEAIEILDRAYELGEFDYNSKPANDEENFYTLMDLVRKAKYLNEIGEYEKAIKFIDRLIDKFNKLSKSNPWELYSLKELYEHRAIINRKSKLFHLALIDDIKSFCYNGMALRGTAKIEKWLEKRNFEVIQNITKPEFINKFLKENSKKINFKYDVNTLTAIIIKIICLDDPNKSPLKQIDNFIKKN